MIQVCQLAFSSPVTIQQQLFCYTNRCLPRFFQQVHDFNIQLEFLLGLKESRFKTIIKGVYGVWRPAFAGYYFIRGLHNILHFCLPTDRIRISKCKEFDIKIIIDSKKKSSFNDVDVTSVRIPSSFINRGADEIHKMYFKLMTDVSKTLWPCLLKVSSIILSGIIHFHILFSYSEIPSKRRQSFVYD